MKDDTEGLPGPYRDFVGKHPDVAKAYRELGRAVRAAGPLSEREVELVKLALSIGAGLEGATHSHVRKALAAGLDRAAIEHVVVLAVPTIGFPASVAASTWIADELAKGD